MNIRNTLKKLEDAGATNETIEMVRLRIKGAMKQETVDEAIKELDQAMETANNIADVLISKRQG